MTNPTTIWHVGQRATINRQTIVTIERVTPAGRPIANGRTFNADGTERLGDPFRRSRLEPLTPEIQAEMDLVKRGQKASHDAFAAVEAADKWLRQALGSWGRKVPEAADVEKVEKLAAAIRHLMEDENVSGRT